MPPLRIAIVHYHLQRGGVTRVIQHAVAELAARNVKAVVLSGNRAPDPREWPCPVKVVEELRYDVWPRTDTGAGVVRALDVAAGRALGGAPDVYHFHNHGLGKNRTVPDAVAHLSRSGRPVLLQIHDFAEDGRPANYGRALRVLGKKDARRLGRRLYPVGPGVHYAVLTPRDHALLARAGVPRPRLHLLPNAVPVPRGRGPRARSAGRHGRFFLYPVVARRRKNLGEFLLWSALGKAGDVFAVTLPPKRGSDSWPGYRDWTRFARSLDLPVRFNVGGAGKSLPALLARADAVATTSVMEGFGLAFIEPWLAGRPVLGRDLPEVTQMFKGAGMDLASLYPRLDVPVEWLGEAALRRKIRSGLARVMRGYGRVSSRRDEARAWGSMVRKGRADFGRLDEASQRRVIRRLVCDPGQRACLRPSALDARFPSPVAVRRNRGIVAAAFGVRGYGCRLLDIYRDVLTGRPAGAAAISAGAILDFFLAPERFSLLRVV